MDAGAGDGAGDGGDQVDGQVVQLAGQQRGAELAGRVGRAAAARAEDPDDQCRGGGEGEGQPAGPRGVGEEEPDQQGGGDQASGLGGEDRRALILR